MKKIFVSLFLFFLILSCENVYADEAGIIKLYDYDYTNLIKAENTYINDGVITGLTTFNIMAEVDSSVYTGVTFNWHVDENSEYIATITSAGTNRCIGRVVGLEEGIAKIWVDAVQDEKIIDSASFYVDVQDMDLGTESYSEIYRENSNVVLPYATDVMTDFEKTAAQHPRIMTNESSLMLTDKYLVYAGLRNKDSSEWNEFETLVYNELNEKYNADKMADDYWDYISEVYGNICEWADEDVSADIEYSREFIEGNLVTTANRIEAEVERVGMIWLMYNARIQNVTSYSDKFSSTEEYRKILASYEDDDYKKYPERIKKIMEMSFSFEDWNPSHFLGTAMMAYSMGVAYDWTYDYLSEEERESYGDKIIELGIKEGNKYLTSVTSQERFESNWCAVSFSGISVAAMAVYESNPYLCAKQIANTSRFLPVFMNKFSPDGALSEGTGYWMLSLRYISYLLSSMDYCLNEDYGMMDVKGFEESWFFGINIMGKDSTDLTKVNSYNYGDANGSKMSQSALLWFAEEKAKKLGTDGYIGQTNLFTWYINQYTDRDNYSVADVQDILWYPLLMSRYQDKLLGADKVTESDLNSWGIDYDKLYANTEPITKKALTEHNLMSDRIVYGRGGKVNIVTSRQSILDRYGTYFALKDTNVKSCHRDADAGSFIFDALGVRWAVDLGKTTYVGKRYSYYQKRAEGHNTIVINPSDDEDQNSNMAANYTGNCIIKNEDYIVGSKAIIVKENISNAYNVYVNENGKTSKNKNKVRRGFMLFDNKSRLMVQDEIQLEEASDIYWFMQTLVKAEDYEINSDGTSVIMTKVNDDGQEVKLKADLKIQTDNPNTAASFITMDYKCISEGIAGNDVNMAFYNTYKDYRKLAVHVSSDKDGNIEKVSKAIITVVLTPVYEEADLQEGMAEVLPMDMWETHSYFTGVQESFKLNKSSIKFARMIKVPLSVSSNKYKNYSDYVEWKSSDENIATVDSNGNVQAVSNGQCVISASIPSDENLYAECMVTVNMPEKIEMDKENLYFDSVKTINLQAVVYPLDCKSNVKWSSSDENIATVDENGHVTAKATGECYIIASVNENKKVVEKCKVVVNLPVEINSAELSLTESSFIYDGKDKQPGVTVVFGGVTLEKDKDYKVSYKDNRNVGIATVTVSGIGDYAGTVTKTFDILPKQVAKLQQKNIYYTEKIGIKWSAVPGVQRYEVYRSTKRDGTYKKIKAVKTNSFTDSSLKPGTSYYYKVVAYNVSGERTLYGEYSDIICATTMMSAPKAYVKAGKNKVTVNWKKEKGVAGYEVFMSSSKNKNYKKIKTTGMSVKSFTKKKLKKGKIYYFKVRSYVIAPGGQKIYSAYSTVMPVKVK